VKSRIDAFKALWLEWKKSFVRWWNDHAAGSPADQTMAWAVAVGVPGVALGLALYPRLTVLICAGIYVWLKIEERKKP